MTETDDRFRLDYEQTTQLMRTLVDIRLKLLAFVPTIAGASVGLVGHPRPAADLLGVGLLGLVATLGIFLYELRNSQIYDAALDRAAQLEREPRRGARRRTAAWSLRRDARFRRVGRPLVVYGAALGADISSLGRAARAGRRRRSEMRVGSSGSSSGSS